MAVRGFGTIVFSFNGELVSLKGTVTINNLGGGEKTVESNMDGSVHYRFTRQIPTADITSISGSSFSVNRLRQLFRECQNNGFSAIFDVSGACSTNGTTYNFINAELIGNMSIDLETGEVTGLQVASQDLRITEEV
jgi:hypothetical protein